MPKWWSWTLLNVVTKIYKEVSPRQNMGNSDVLSDQNQYLCINLYQFNIFGTLNTQTYLLCF